MKDALREVFRDMDPATGLFPAGWQCLGCGKTLNADGGHPAELYAGTYTGLCYGCERKPSYIQGTYTLDGALLLSYPPHAPSWRRARESFTAYVDCGTCEGRGRLMKRGQWEQYPVQCQMCFERFYGQPLRRWASQRESRIRRAAQNVYEAVLRRARLYGLAKRGKAPSDRLDALRAPVWARYERVMVRWRGLRATRPVDDRMPVTAI